MKKSDFYKLNLSKSNIDKIILNVTGYNKTKLFLLDEIEDCFVEQINLKINRLNSGEPLEYIVNTTDFYSFSFYVDSRVLIPRNETELLVDKTLEEIIKLDNITYIDVGTGSSCIAISILKNTNKIKHSYVIDVSNKALEVSLINLDKFGLKNVIQIKSNLLQKVLGDFENYIFNKNIIITANLPYIKNKDFENIDLQTLKYEPKIALFGGEKTGFEIYENLIFQSQVLKKQKQDYNVILFIEIGFDQGEYSKKYLENLGLNFSFYYDNNEILRVIKIKI